MASVSSLGRRGCVGAAAQPRSRCPTTAGAFIIDTQPHHTYLLRVSASGVWHAGDAGGRRGGRGGGRGRGAGAGAGAGAGRREALRAPPPDAELLQCAAALANTKRLFSALLDQLCDEPDFADDDNEHCWNGHTVGDRHVGSRNRKSCLRFHIGDASLPKRRQGIRLRICQLTSQWRDGRAHAPTPPPASPTAPPPFGPYFAHCAVIDQKYNPEIEGRAPQDPEVAALADRLRQARQVRCRATAHFI
ncbi:hypothetical protein MSG28_000544 [Choristoneura fumiferana]|uniref:Uncharacterized protein n=1 Tax=Choristoneura fumiferana TaxID=7141 RepID=A0ACC0K183_CHOFU|nr:hypothetical protein MSG28_000544 [Choristoneura fumiferana]